MNKNFKMLLAAMMLVATGASAQEQVPVDKDVRIGRLENGLTYYIRHNELPKQRAEFHIAQAVGATLEEDNQNGLAHFLEHMCFNGTENFPGKLIINYFESVGVNFGGNINAYTSLDKTVYRLSEVPTYREGIVDSALLVMHDWSCAVSLLGEEIDNERGVIREEWRTGNTASRRLWKRGQAVMFPGTRYAIRDVIGDTAVINNFSYEALRSYYKKWYGPDLQAIIVVGDVDVDAIEAKIKKLWADVPARENRGERPYVQVEDNQEPIVGILQDKEAQQTAITVLYKHEPLPAEVKQTINGEVFTLCNELIYKMLSERLNEIKLKPEAPITGGFMAYSDLVPTVDAFYSRIIAKEGQEKEALTLLLTQIEKMKRYGFTADELERAKTATLNDVEKQYNERNATRNISYVNEYIANFLEKSPIPGIEWEYETLKQVLPMLNVAAINQLAAQYVTENNCVVCIQAPLKDEVALPSEEEIRAELASMSALEIEAPKASMVDGNLVKKAPKAGKIKKVSKNASLGTTEWTLSNGVKVVLKPTTFKKDEISMSAFSRGGLSMVKDEDLVNANLATAVVEFMGLGNYSTNDLEKALTGKTVSCSPSINPNTESMEGESSIKDFETMLQLAYLYFTAPRKDEEGFNTLKGLLENNLRNKYTNPKAEWQDSIQMTQDGHSPRVVLFNLESIKRLDMNKALAIYKKRFANAADFTFTFVGNIDPEDEATQKLICTYLGGLKTCGKREGFVDNGVRAPKGVVKNYFTKEMTTHTASNRIQYTSYDIPYSLENSLNMSIIGRILSTRYLESIREREGGSYGVGCYGYLQKWPVAKAGLIMQFDTDPEKQEKLIGIIHEEVKTIVENGPLATDLQKEKESMLKDLQEDLEKNSWWVSTIETFYKSGLNYVEDYENAVKGITAETVQATLKKLVESGNMFEVVMTPAEEK